MRTPQELAALEYGMLEFPCSQVAAAAMALGGLYVHEPAVLR